MVTDWDFINGRITKKVVRTTSDGSRKTILVIQKGIMLCGDANKVSTHLAQFVCNSIYPKRKR